MPNYKASIDPNSLETRLSERSACDSTVYESAYFALDNNNARVECLDEARATRRGVSAGRRQGDYLVLNRIVSLKEDSDKAA